MIYNKKFLKGTAKGQNDVFAIFIKVGIVGTVYVVWSFGDQEYSSDGEPMVNILYGERDVRSQKRLILS